MRNLVFRLFEQVEILLWFIVAYIWFLNNSNISKTCLLHQKSHYCKGLSYYFTRHHSGFQTENILFCLKAVQTFSKFTPLVTEIAVRCWNNCFVDFYVPCDVERARKFIVYVLQVVRSQGTRWCSIFIYSQVMSPWLQPQEVGLWADGAPNRGRPIQGP